MCLYILFCGFMIRYQCNLRFIFALLHECGAVNEINLQCLTKLSICQALLTAINQRQVGSGRIHAIFLLIKKVLVFLSSQESSRLHQFTLPSTYESYLFVDNICGESSQKRKQESRNRIVLGAHSSLQLMNQRAASSSTPFTIPST